MSLADTIHPLPWAPAGSGWSWEERSQLGVHGACDLILRTKAAGEGPPLPPDLQLALPLLLHELEQCEDALAKVQPDAAKRAATTEAIQRVLPRLLTYRFVDSSEEREFVFAATRPGGLHVLSRVLETPFKFRLEDLSHFASHGALVVDVLDAVGLEDVIDPARILYCPAVDAPYPFKFIPVGGHGARNRDAYVKLLQRLLRQTESDEAFRARNFRELVRGFQKFGPAAATPQFQEVELRLWKLLSYIAARLRVKAGRLTDTRDPEKARGFVAELHAVHAGLDELVHLPSRLAAYYRANYALELTKLYEQALAGLESVAKKVDADLSERDRSIDAIAEMVSEFRRLGSTSPLESLEEQDREVLVSYGDARVPPPETGWARTYREVIHTGAVRFDVRRFSNLPVDDTSEENLDLDLDLTRTDDEEDADPDDEWEDAETLVEDEGQDVRIPSDEQDLLESSDIGAAEPEDEELAEDEETRTGETSDFSDLIEGLEGDEEEQEARPAAARKAPPKPAKPKPPAPTPVRPAARKESGPSPAAKKPAAPPPHKRSSGEVEVAKRSSGSHPTVGKPATPGARKPTTTPPAMQRPGQAAQKPKPGAPNPARKKTEPEQPNFEDLLREAADEFGK